MQSSAESPKPRAQSLSATRVCQVARLEASPAQADKQAMRTVALAVTSLLTAVVPFTLEAPVLGQVSPAAASSRLDADVLALACAPAAATSAPKAMLRISGGQDPYPRLTFSQGD